MGGDALQEGMVTEAYGQITPPPDIADIVEKIRTAAQFKQWLELSPAELRVLCGLLDTAE